MKNTQEELSTYNVSIEEFQEWAEKEHWILIHSQDYDFGEKHPAAPHLNKVEMGKGYIYLTPMGIKVTILVKNGNVIIAQE